MHFHIAESKTLIQVGMRTCQPCISISCTNTRLRNRRRMKIGSTSVACCRRLCRSAPAGLCTPALESKRGRHIYYQEIYSRIRTVDLARIRVEEILDEEASAKVPRARYGRHGPATSALPRLMHDAAATSVTLVPLGLEFPTSVLAHSYQQTNIFAPP